ncbi:MAG TPA: MtrB/PioB family outer membrane beta-barrel protein [Burkholderiaceae bacterium]|nr:MtrB/PioB family outer membrane beta-barrel protein [Burkholderiaceae bacterium]
MPAWADSAQGVDTLLGNGANPTGQDPTVAPGQQAVGTFRPGGSHTPTGLHYQVPPAYPAANKTDAGWLYNLSFEAGFWGKGANEDNPLFRQYRDWHNGPTLNWFGVTAERPDTASYLNFIGSDVGRRDQFYGLEFGKYNDFKVKAFVNQIPHALGEGTTYFRGAGSTYLSLPPALTPGNSALTAVDAAAKDGAPYTFKVQRNRAGLRGDWDVGDRWKAYTSYTYERREGSRPMGGSMFFPVSLGPGGTVGGISELIEPIDYQTHDLAFGMQFANGLTQFNVGVTASLFRNANNALTWENPFNVGSLGPPNPASSNLKLGQMALAPDNQAYSVKAEYVRAFPELRNAHFDASVALGRMRQNDNLLSPSVNTGLGGNAPFTWNNADWNTTGALSQKTADARIDTTLVNLQASAVPLDRLTVRAKARYYETRNHTQYTAYNPITGQYGYLAEGGGQGTAVPGEAGFYAPGAGFSHYRSIPFEGTQQNYVAEADYRVRSKTTVTASYERENFLRHYRERDRTWEDKLKLSVAERGFGEGTVRASYEYDSRRGGAYNSNPYEAFYTSSLPGVPADTVPHTLDELRKYDLSDRKQQILNLRYNRSLRDDLDVGVTLQQKWIDWGAEFGRVDAQTQSSLNLDLSWSPSDGTTGYAYYSYDRSSIRQANVNDSAAGINGSANYGGNVYPTDDRWSVQSRDRTDVLGLGLKKSFNRGILLDASYSFTRSSTAIGYGYANAGGAVLGSPGTALPDIGNAFPNMTYRLHSLQGSVLVPASKQLSWRFIARYEQLAINDWHYTGLVPGALPSNAGGLLPATFIDLGPRNYHSVVFGVLLQYKL